MGLFSWCSCVSGRSIPVGSDATLLLPNDTIISGTYSGYGGINGIDVHILFQTGWDVSKTRALTQALNRNSSDTAYAQNMRGKAITLDYAFNPGDGGGCGFKFMLTNEYKPGMKYADLPTSFTCPWQGYFYDGRQRKHPKFIRGHGPEIRSNITAPSERTLR